MPNNSDNIPVIDDPTKFGYEHYEQKLHQCFKHNSKLPPAKPPRPLHRSFYQTTDSINNRETERWTCRHVHTTMSESRVTCHSDQFNSIKRQVKSIRMRQSVASTVGFVLSSPELYTQEARDQHQLLVEDSKRFN